MDGELDAGVAPSIFLPGQFSDAPSAARKRDFPWTNPGSHQQQSHLSLVGSGFSNPSNSNGWNPKLWDWDSLKFTAKPSLDAPEALCIGAQEAVGVIKNGNGAGQTKDVGESGKTLFLGNGVEEDSETLTLKIGMGACAVEELVTRSNKRVRSGSPGSSASYLMCQVDDCKTDLSNAKDYHRRHKVCELHSKTAKAIVGQQMQRFCQQCSRFHHLTEFDEGKRSCRRRLAGHNRRRRKTQPEDASTNILVPAGHDGKANGSVDIVNLFAILARLQDNTAGHSTNTASVPEREPLLHILDKVGNLPPENTSSRTQAQRGFDLNVSEAPQQSSWKQPFEESGNLSAPSTMNLLAVLSAALASSSPNTLTNLLQGSSDGSGVSQSNRTCRDTVVNIISNNKLVHIFPPDRGREDDFNVHSHVNSSEHPVQIVAPRIPLQLFGSAEDDSPPKLGSARLGSASKYPSSQSSNLIEDRSPSYSPPVAKRLFPLQSASERKDESMLTCKEEHATADARTSCGLTSSLKLFKDPGRQFDNQTVQKLPYQGGYSSSSSSDQFPSSSNFDAQDRTGRIIFKLFDKDPSKLPGTLKTEILNWLSHGPSEIESYIRPGCVVLSIYLCMTSMAWHELEENFLQRVNSLVNFSESGFWKNTRFLIRTSTQLASHKDGIIRVCRSWKTLSAPELTFISPIAVIGGQETTLILKGRNLTVPGTIIRCTSKGVYSSKNVGSTHLGTTVYDDSSSECFILPEGSPYSFGRYFIEVDRSFKGNSFPIIIADSAICLELRSLEFEFYEDVGTMDTSFQDQCLENGRPQSREDILHFLNELGWLFQRKSYLDDSFISFSTLRFKHLISFSVERDFSELVKKLLDIIVESGAESHSILHESPELLLELQLLNRAVKRKCRKMVDMLLNYYVKNKITKDSRVYLFPPNSTGPGGLTPLHLAASMQDAEGMVDALTNDPQEIGLTCWASVLDDRAQSPCMRASSRNYHSYNMLVARKLADKQNCRVSIMIGHEVTSMDKSWQVPQSPVMHGIGCVPAAKAVNSCAQCSLAETQPVRITPGNGLLQWPYVHSVLAIATICVCVCLFLRGAPWVGYIAPFKWEKLDFGPR